MPTPTVKTNLLTSSIVWNHGIVGSPFFVVFMLFLCMIPSCSGQSDESGTLVMAARTQSAAIVGIDSQISGDDIEIDPGRKLLSLGSVGACGIEGWEGLKSKHIVLKRDLDAYLRVHPARSLATSLPELLKVAGVTWMKPRYPLHHLPNNRQVGQEITQLVCVGIVNSKPTIMRGEIDVGTHAEPVVRMLQAECGDLLYVSGVISLYEFYFFNDDPDDVKKQLSTKDLFDAVRLKIMQDIVKDFSLRSSYSVWKGFAKPSRFEQSRFCTTKPLDIIPPAWSLPVVQVVFKGMFNAVEHNTKLVSKPNNVMIFDSTGSRKSTVEGDWQPKVKPSVGIDRK